MCAGTGERGRVSLGLYMDSLNMEQCRSTTAAPKQLQAAADELSSLAVIYLSADRQQKHKSNRRKASTERCLHDQVLVEANASGASSSTTT